MPSQRFKALIDSPQKIFSIFMTAGFPNLNDTVAALRALAAAGVNLVELGMPFSDPIADGPTVQASSNQAIKNGMNLPLIFAAVREFRTEQQMPIVLMGSINTVLQFGVEKFVAECCDSGVDGVILADLPLDEYRRSYLELFKAGDLPIVPLVSPTTSEARLADYDSISSGLLYLVSSFGVTGGSLALTSLIVEYLDRVRRCSPSSKRLVGFGITGPEQVSDVLSHAEGVVVGSAFIRHLEENGVDAEKIRNFVAKLAPFTVR